MRTPRPTPGVPRVLAAPAAALVNMAPPGRSRLPVSTLTTSISQLVSVPKACVVVPMRPYTAAVGAAASRRARSTIVAASTPVTGRDRGRREAGQRRPQLVEAGDVAADGPEVDQLLLEQRGGDRGQQVGVRAGSDRHPLRRRLGGAAATGIDDHELAAPLEEALPAGPASRGRWPGCRWTRTGWRRGRAGSRCGRGRAPGWSADRRTSSPPTPPWAAGRRCRRSTPGGCRAPARAVRGTRPRRCCGRSGCRGRCRGRRARDPRSRPRGRRRRRPRPRPSRPRRARRRAARADGAAGRGPRGAGSASNPSGR